MPSCIILPIVLEIEYTADTVKWVSFLYLNLEINNMGSTPPMGFLTILKTHEIFKRSVEKETKRQRR